MQKSRLRKPPIVSPAYQRRLAPLLFSKSSARAKVISAIGRQDAVSLHLLHSFTNVHAALARHQWSAGQAPQRRRRSSQYQTRRRRRTGWRRCGHAVASRQHTVADGAAQRAVARRLDHRRAAPLLDHRVAGLSPRRARRPPPPMRERGPRGVEGRHNSNARLNAQTRCGAVMRDAAAALPERACALTVHALRSPLTSRTRPPLLGTRRPAAGKKLREPNTIHRTAPPQ